MKYKFITPSVDKLLGFNIDELNEIGFETLILNQFEENRNKYPLNSNADGSKIEEVLNTYFIETKDQENKWIEKFHRFNQNYHTLNIKFI